MRWPWSESIAQRILWGYYVLVALVAVTMILMWSSLAEVRKQIYVLESTSELLDSVLEIRRYEKNWLLYRDTSEFLANGDMIDVVMELIDGRSGSFTHQDSATTVRQLRETLTVYRQLMGREFEIYRSGQKHMLAEQIRAEGKKLVELAEVLNHRVRAVIDRTLELMTVSGVLFVGFVTLLALLLGRKMATAVVKPLQQLVQYTRQIGAGQFAPTATARQTVEVKAVVESLTAMLDVLEKREKQIIQSEKLAAIGTLVAGVAHELNNPLSNAGTSAQILLEDLQEPDTLDLDFCREMVLQIVDQTGRARSIVRALLEFSREKEVRPEQLRISQFLSETSRLVRGEMPPQVDFRIATKADGLFWADKRKLQQALVNLLLNAVHAVGERGVIELRGRIDEGEKKVYFEVRDDGPGISATVREKIFDPFFTTKDVGEGSGLGLAVTREIVGKHGGTISVESEEGRGSCFMIALPVKIADLLIDAQRMEEVADETSREDAGAEGKSS